MKITSRIKKRLLFYNWAPFDDLRLEGGGVSVYLRNLLEELVTRQGLEVFYLSSGLRRNWYRRQPYLRETRNALSDRGVRSFEIVNSPVRVPGRRMAHAVHEWRSDLATRDIVASFMTQYGEFDAFHIHNLEGISSAVLCLKAQFPRCRFIYTWHNYIPVCPQVHLLFRDESTCLDFEEGRRCVECVGDRLRSALRGLHSSVVPHTVRWQDRAAASYWSWRETNAGIMNNCIDGMLAVSDIAKATVVSLGIDPDKVTVLPLGMDVYESHENMVAAWKAKPAHPRFTFSFAGYAWPYKGLPFLIEALERADSSFLRRNVDFVVLADLGNNGRLIRKRIRRLFHKVTFINGYKRDELGDLARQIDVNVVPSIWAETYSQIAYEFMCFGTPSLLSSSVGFGMFYENKDAFTYAVNDHDDLARRMISLARSPQMLEVFWSSPTRLPTMSEHADALLDTLLA